MDKQVRIANQPSKVQNGYPSSCKTICKLFLKYGHILFNTCRKPALNKIKIAERTTLRKLTKFRYPRNPIFNPFNNFLNKKKKKQKINLLSPPFSYFKDFFGHQ